MRAIRSASFGRTVVRRLVRMTQAKVVKSKSNADSATAVIDISGQVETKRQRQSLSPSPCRPRVEQATEPTSNWPMIMNLERASDMMVTSADYWALLRVWASAHDSHS